ncbi:MAG: hypothetical protein QOI51_1767 [Nocardioidaceae bacterium]|nr:hypothetical protein [Nocardioidaceae bacterium]
MRPLRYEVRRGPTPDGSAGGTCVAPSVATLAGLLAIGFLAAGCSSGASSAAEIGLGPDRPVVGACRVLTLADIAPATNQTPPVSCRSPHTAVTISVGGFLRSRVTNANLSDGTLGNDALKRCTASWRRTVGGDTATQDLSVVGLAYYLPTSAELSKGARWYRCDLVIGGQDGMRLRDLPAHVAGLLDGPLPDSLRACRTAPDFQSGHQVACSRPHVLRAVGTTSLPDRTSYPGKAALKAASAKGCLPVVRRWLKGKDDGGIAYQWPDANGWRLLGDRTATCWTVTTD